MKALLVHVAVYGRYGSSGQPPLLASSIALGDLRQIVGCLNASTTHQASFQDQSSAHSHKVHDGLWPSLKRFRIGVGRYWAAYSHDPRSDRPG